MFDPEKVERVTANANFTDDDGHRRYWDYDVIRAEDYDQLLEIHLRHVGMIAELFSKCGEPLSEDKIASLKNGTWR